MLLHRNNQLNDFITSTIGRVPNAPPPPNDANAVQNRASRISTSSCPVVCATE